MTKLIAPNLGDISYSDVTVFVPGRPFQLHCLMFVAKANVLYYKTLQLHHVRQMRRFIDSKHTNFFDKFIHVISKVIICMFIIGIAIM